MDQLDVSPRCRRELFEIVTVDGHDLVPVRREQDDSGVDDISEAAGREELPRGSSQRFVKGAHVDAGERLRQAGLTRAAPPHLPEDPGVGEREISLHLRGLEADPHRAFVALQRHQGTTVEDEAHPDLA